MLKLFNSMGRRLQAFKPTHRGEVRMYTCGPTVWNYAHLGNYRTFVFEDVLGRYLRFKGYKVIQVRNITDVEDRIIRGIRETGKGLAELTGFYEAAFHEDLASLGVEKADFYPRATKHIDDMIKLIGTLMDKGYAYKAADGSTYFDVSKFKDYGALSGVTLGSLKPAGRVSADHYEEKREAADFALWKAWDQADGEVYWETPLGKGRPGWHIECSAMSMKYLGETFDIHTGGADLLFPHHENEIAQSEAATGKKFVNYWLHAEFLHVRGAEMHKSVGNVVLLKDLVRQGWDPLTIRTFLVSARYRDPMDFSEVALEQARAQRLRLQELVTRLRATAAGPPSPGEPAAELLSEFEAAMDDDLNTPRAFAALFVSAKRANSLADSGKLTPGAAAAMLASLKKVNSVLGILTLAEEELPGDLAALLQKREEARRRKDFAESDRLRGLLYAQGVIVEDTPAGTRWKRRTG